MISVSALVIISLLITLRFKISIHAAAIWGVAGIFVGLSTYQDVSALFYAAVISFVLAGLISASRLHLNRHQPVEIWTGALLGFIMCYGWLVWWPKIL